MRIGVVVDNLNPAKGGSYTFQKSLLDAIDTEQGKHRFVVLYMGNGVHDRHSLVPLIDLQAEYAGRFRATLRLGRKLLDELCLRLYSLWPLSGSNQGERSNFTPVRRLIMQARRSLIIEQAAHDYDIDVIWFLAPVFSKLNIPFFFTVWDLQHRVQPFFPEVSTGSGGWDNREQVFNTMLPRAAKVICGTHAGKKEIEYFYRVYPDNIKVIPFPTPAFISTARAPGNVEIGKKYPLKKPYLLYPAQFWPHKNHVNVLRALSILKKTHAIQLDVVFVGSDKGNEQYVRRTVRAMQLCEQVHFFGFVPEQDLIAFYKGAVALLFASFFGPDNLPPLEAFALGCPVIASRVSGAEEQLGDAALLFDPGRPEEMAIVIKKVFTDSRLREALVEKGLARADNGTAHDYLRDIGRSFDEFEAMKLCWSSPYRYNRKN